MVVSATDHTIIGLMAIHKPNDGWPYERVLPGNVLCRPSSATGDKDLVVGVRDCTVVGGGTSLLKTQSTPVREISGK